MTGVAKHHICSCGKPRQYSYAHDALYCEMCDRWLEEGCGDALCIFCNDRKDKPSSHGLCVPVGATMTDNEINIAIAEACGWKVSSGDDDQMGWHIAPPDSGYMNSPHLPDYANDLNAMRTAIETLEVGFDGSQADEYEHALWVLTNPGIPFSREPLFDVAYLYRFITSTARQQAEAFLKTLGKWQE